MTGYRTQTPRPRGCACGVPSEWLLAGIHEGEGHTIHAEACSEHVSEAIEDLENSGAVLTYLTEFNPPP